MRAHPAVPASHRSPPTLLPGRPGLLHALLLLLLLSLPAPARAQEGARLAAGDTLWEVHLVGGESYVGRVVEVNGDVVTLETVTGTRIQFPRSQAVRVRPARGVLRGDSFWMEDPNHTRLFFSPTARTLSQGEGYFGVYEVFIPFIAYGFSDRFLIAGGSPFYVTLMSGDLPPLYIAPKVLVVDSERFSASLGGLAVVAPGDEETYTMGIVYGVGTWGSTDHAVSSGLGWGYIEDEISSKPVAMLGGETRVGRYTKLITENLVVPGEAVAVLSGGVRFFGERLSADAGLAAVIGDGESIWLPVVNFVYNFGPER